MARVEQRKTMSRIVTTWGATLHRSFRQFFSVIKKPSILSADWIAPQGSDRVPPPFVALSSSALCLHVPETPSIRALSSPREPLGSRFTPLFSLFLLPFSLSYSLSLSHQILLFTNWIFIPGRSIGSPETG